MAKRVTPALVLAAVLIAASLGAAPGYAQQKPEFNPFGPVLDEKDTKMILAYDARLLAFEAGDIDAVGVLPKDLERIQKSKPIAELGGEIVRTVPFTQSNLIQINLRDRIGPVGNPDNPDITLPYNVLSNKLLRHAIAHLMDRDKIIFGPLLQGQAIKSSTIVPPMYGSWVNPDKSKVDFEVRFPLSLEKANQLLDQAGLTRPPGSKFRTYVVPRTDAAGRPYPDAGQTKPLEIEVLVFTEAANPVAFQIFRMYQENGEKVGINFKPKTVSAPTRDALILGTRSFQAYLTSGWFLGSNPTFMRNFWHSDEDRWVGKRPEGFNRYGIRDPELDKLLEEFIETTDLETARRALWKAQEIVTEYVPWVPDYATISFTAISGKWKGKVLAFAPPTPDALDFSWFTDLNFFTVNPDTKQSVFGDRFNDASSIILNTLNPMTYTWLAEANVIATVYDFATVANPSDIYARRWPILAQDWAKEEIELEGKPGMKLTLKLKDGVRWHDGAPLTAFDFEWTILNPGVNWKTLRYGGLSFVKRLVRTEVPDAQTLVVYVRSRSWTFLEVELLPFRPLPRHLMSRVTDPFGDLSRLPHPERADLTLMVGTGPFILAQHESGRVVRTVWNPEYHLRHLKKGLNLQVIDPPKILEEGGSVALDIRVTDYLGKIVADAELTATLKGPIATAIRFQSLGGGAYRALLGGSVVGTYTVTVSGKRAIPYGFLRGETTFSIDVFPKGLPPPPAAPKVEEKAPTPIALPTVPSLPAAPTLPEVSVAAESPLSQLMQVAAAVIIIALGFVAARKRS